MFTRKNGKSKKTLSALLATVMSMSVFTATAVTTSAVTESDVEANEATAQIISEQTLNNDTATTSKTLYLKPNANWIKSDARFAMCVTGESGSQWISMTDLNDGYYSADVPAGDYTTVEFARMNPKSDANTDSNKWNYSGKMTIPTDKMNCFTIDAGQWNDVTGEWSVYISKASLKKLYLKPNANWIKTDARFAMQVFGPNGSEWVSMDDAGDGYYTAYVPLTEYTEVKFARMSGSSSSNTEANIWNYSSKMTFPVKADDKNCFTIDDYQWNDVSGSWGVFTPTVYETDVLYLKPNANWIGAHTNPRFSAYLYGGNSPATWVSMTKVEDGNYKLVIPEGDYAKVMFARMNPNTTEDAWVNLWNDSIEMEIPTNGTNRFVVGDNEWSSALGKWDSITELKTLYLEPNANWKGSNARFSAYLYGGDSPATWVSMTKLSDGTYKADIPAGHYTKVIYVRMNPNTTENIWANNWNESTPQRIPANTTDLFTLNANDWNSATGVWSTYVAKENPNISEATISVNKGDVVNYWVEVTVPDGGKDIAGWLIDMNYDKDMFTINYDFAGGKAFAIGDNAIDYALGLTDEAVAFPGSPIAQYDFETLGRASVIDVNADGLNFKGKTTKLVCIQLVATASGESTLSFGMRDFADTDAEYSYFDTTTHQPINGAKFAIKYSID